MRKWNRAILIDISEKLRKSFKCIYLLIGSEKFTSIAVQSSILWPSSSTLIKYKQLQVIRDNWQHLIFLVIRMEGYYKIKADN